MVWGVLPVAISWAIWKERNRRIFDCTEHGAMAVFMEALTYMWVAGLPTNINFLQRLANHWAFANGEVETHFIEHFKSELFIDPSDTTLAAEAYDAARRAATILAACVCEKEHTDSKESIRGINSLNMLWYNHPPFRVHHFVRRVLEFEWENEYDNESKLVMVNVTYQPHGTYFVETGDGDSPGFEVKVVLLGPHEFRVEADGLSMDVNVAVYSKERANHIHIWHGKHHHHFTQSIGLDLSNDDGSQHKQGLQMASHPRGSVVAPMAGLVIKVLLKDGMKVVEGQPVLVLEAMKMEHIVKAPSAGCIYGLQVSSGQQVFDNTILFTIKDE